MPKVFIIHGWDGYPKEAWLPWLKKELTIRGFKVEVPLMPNPEEPKIEIWVSYLAKIVNKPDKNTYFVGYSIGCQTILRYLETLPKNTKIGGAVFTAGWFTLMNLKTADEKKIAKPWLENPINYNKIKKTTGKLCAIFSDNDPFVPLENKNLFSQRLKAKIIIEKGKGHFGAKELPSVLNNLLIFSKKNKKLRFAENLIPFVLSGKKTSTWRFFDDKNLSQYDILEFLNSKNNKIFALAEITEAIEKKLGDITEKDKKGHETFASEQEMYKTYENYYHQKLDRNTLIKILRFRLLEKYK